MITNRSAMQLIGEADPSALVYLVHEGERYPLGQVTYLSGSEPMETILEGSDPASDPFVNASRAVSDMLSNDPEGRVQVYLKEGDLGQYFEADGVSLSHPRGDVYIGTGAFIADTYAA